MEFKIGEKRRSTSASVIKITSIAALLIVSAGLTFLGPASVPGVRPLVFGGRTGGASSVVDPPATVTSSHVQIFWVDHGNSPVRVFADPTVVAKEVGWKYQ